MQLNNSIEEDLAAAVRSARRLRDHPVHADTLQHWEDLLHHARRDLAAARDGEQWIEPLVMELQTEISSRTDKR